MDDQWKSANDRIYEEYEKEIEEILRMREGNFLCVFLQFIQNFRSKGSTFGKFPQQIQHRKLPRKETQGCINFRGFMFSN